MSNNRPLYLILGPSGSGKTTIVRRVCEMMRVEQVKSFTTRPRRAGERSDHTHVSNEFFDEIMAKSDIVAYTEYDGHRYCADREMVDDGDLYIIDPAGAEMLEKAKARGELNRPLIEVYITAGEEVRRQRMLKRGNAPEDIRKRARQDRESFAGWCPKNYDGGVFMKCDDRLNVINKDGALDASVLKVIEFIASHWLEGETA